MTKRRERPMVASSQLIAIKEVPELDETIKKLIEEDKLSKDTKEYSMGSLYILVSPAGNGKRWHMQIIGTTRYPTIEEILRIRFSLLPREMKFVMEVPTTEAYFEGKMTFMFYQSMQ